MTWPPSPPSGHSGADNTGATIHAVRSSPLVLAAVIVCVACGSDAKTAPETMAVAATSSTTTSPSPSTVATTTTVAISRDARLAMERCRDALGQFFASQVGALGGGRKELNDAGDLCDEAELQLKADNPPSGSLGDQLIEQILGLKVSMGFADLKLLSDKFDVTAEHTLQDAVDKFDKKVDALLKS